ncbi:MAG: phosphoglucosamine mutase, partial [Nitriliruptorales bacterium]
PGGTDVGRIIHDEVRKTTYVQHLVDAAETELGGLKVVVDGANGAASHIAPLVYRRLGADVETIHCDPNGANINAGAGSTHPEVISSAVLEHGADVGLSHDGDADRLVAATREGDEVDGDVTLAILARHRKQIGTLKGDLVVTTVMTNLGFKRSMERHGIEVVETPVGDRYVLAAMRGQGAVLGGEQSGHLIVLDEATTGDGILTAVKLLSVVRETGTPLAELASVMERLPQVLVNVRVADRDALEGSQAVWDAVAAEETLLGDEGRILLRASGTETVVRVMVEAPTEAAASEVAGRLADVVRAELGA